MRIAMVGQKHIPSREGGIEVAVGELSVRMAAMGNRVDAYNRGERDYKNSSKSYKGVHLHKIPTFRWYVLNAFVYSVLAMLCAVFRRPQIIHIHAEGPAAMAWIPKLFGIPTVVTIHGLDWKRDKWGGFASRYLKFGEKVAVKCADEIIVLSRAMCDYFLHTYNRKTILIKNGVDFLEPHVPEKIKTKWGLERNEYIFFAARLVPEKGAHYLVDAFKKLKTDKKLVIAGKIYDSEYARHLCRMVQEDSRIIMTDFVEGQILAELFSNALLYVIPSDIEGMAISLLEALSCGTLCLASDIDDNKQIADQYIRFFRKGDVEDLKQKLEECLISAQTTEQKQEQIAYMKKHYDWDHVTRQTLSLYCSLLKKKG